MQLPDTAKDSTERKTAWYRYDTDFDYESGHYDLDVAV
jgi:hypothetical protein